MKAKIMKPCMVIVLDMLYKHAPGPVPLTYISRSFDCQNFTSSVFFNTIDARIMKPYIVIIRDILYKHAP